MLPLLLFLSACSQKPAMMAPPPSPVVVQTLAADTISDYTEFVATLISRNSVTLQPQVPGQITAIYVKAGDRVRAGQALLLIDPSQQQAAVASAGAAAQSQQATVSQANENLGVLQKQRQALQSALETSQLQYDRYAGLAAQNSASRQDVEQSLNALNQARANLDANTAQMRAQRALIMTARRQYQQAQALTRQQQAQLKYHRIAAPFSGMVGDVPVKLGNYVQPMTNLISVTNNNQLEINISVPAERVTDLRVGLPVEILTESGRPLGETTLSFVSPKVDERAQTILTKAILKNPEGLLKADQIVNARIVWKTRPGLRVPTQAVVHMGGRDFVYRMDATGPKQFVARQVPVTLGDIEGPFYVLQSGLKAGDSLIISGIQKLADGAPVNPQ
jgi:multidrug efflux pump subunit AcrA (membrane-fusion protein)